MSAESVKGEPDGADMAGVGLVRADYRCAIGESPASPWDLGIVDVNPPEVAIDRVVAIVHDQKDSVMPLIGLTLDLAAQQRKTILVATISGVDGRHEAGVIP